MDVYGGETALNIYNRVNPAVRRTKSHPPFLSSFRYHLVLRSHHIYALLLSPWGSRPYRGKSSYISIRGLWSHERPRPAAENAPGSIPEPVWMNTI